MNANELRNERAKIAADMRKVLDKADAEKRALTGEETQQWEKMNADVDAKAAQIEQQERMASLEKELAEPRSKGIGHEQMTIAKDGGKEARNERQDKLVAERREYMRSGAVGAEMRAITGFGDSSITGLAVDDGFAVSIYDVLKSYVGMRAAPITNIVTNTGLDYPYLVSDDTSNTGEMLSELGSVGGGSDTEATVTQSILKSYTFTSKPIVTSIQALNDIEALEKDVIFNAGVRIARIQNNKFTLGTGTSQPMGLVTAISTTVTAATGNTLLVPSDNLFDLEHSVDPAFRALKLPNGLPACGFMMNDATLKVVKKIKDTTNRYLWQPGLSGFSGAAPDTIDGYPYYINQDMAVPAANAKSIVFGHFPSFVIRDVKGAQLLRLTERYADLLAVGFIAYLRSDSRLKSANAFAVFAHSAT